MKAATPPPCPRRTSTKIRVVAKLEKSGFVWDARKILKLSSRILECERCENHYCSKCIKLTDSEYGLLNSRKDLH